MILSRRSVLQIGGGFLAALPFGSVRAWGAEPVDINMSGNADGSLVWFDPIGLLIQPGQTVRWTNRDPATRTRRPPTTRTTRLIRCAFPAVHGPGTPTTFCRTSPSPSSSPRLESTIISASRTSMPGWSVASSSPAKPSRWPRHRPATYRKSQRRPSQVLRTSSEGDACMPDDRRSRSENEKIAVGDPIPNAMTTKNPT